MNTVCIGGRAISFDNPTLVIAELGINHNGDVANVFALIDAAVAAGCEMVKFQKRTVDVVYTEAELKQSRVTPWGETNGQLKWHLELDQYDYEKIVAYCAARGVMWCASPWDVASVDFLEQYNVVCHKVASACITDVDLLKRIGATGKPVIMSTGMSTWEEVDRAVAILDETNTPLILLHTVATYPARLEEINLSVMGMLQLRYPHVLTGYSGHEEGLMPSLAAVALGARVVERHVTLSRRMFGSDQKASIEPHELAQLVTGIREIELAMGTPEKKVLEREVPVREKLRRFK